MAANADWDRFRHRWPAAGPRPLIRTTVDSPLARLVMRTLAPSCSLTAAVVATTGPVPAYQEATHVSSRTAGPGTGPDGAAAVAVGAAAAARGSARRRSGAATVSGWVVCWRIVSALPRIRIPATVKPI